MNSLTTRLSCLKAALLYIDGTGNLASVKERCLAYNSLQDRVFHFVINVHPSDLVEMHSALGNMLLTYTPAASSIFQEVIFYTIKTLKLIEVCESQNQITVAFKLETLPAFIEYQIQNSAHLSKAVKDSTFKQYTGVITGTSLLRKYTKSAHFLCPRPQCEGSYGYKFVRIHVAGAKETQTIRGDFKCSFCGVPLNEDVTHRMLADKLILELVDVEALKTSRTGSFAHSCTVYLRDELASTSLELGSLVTVIGKPVFNLVKSQASLEASNIFLKTTELCKEGLFLEQLSGNLKKLRQDRASSPWTFGMSLAYAFAADVIPSSTFIFLKLGLLLSLASQSQELKDIVHILAIAKDSCILHKLLNYASNLATRQCTHTQHKYLGISVNKDQYDADVPFLEGGSLLLAHGGICFIPELSSAKSTHQAVLAQALQSEKIQMSVPSKLQDQQTASFTQPLRCAAWSYLEDGGGNKDQGGRDAPLIDAFGLAFYCGYEPSSDTEHLLVQQILRQSLQPSNEELITFQDFQTFFEFIRSLNVTLGADATWYIRGYYVGSRRARNEHDVTIPVNALKTISSLAVAFCRLNMRTEATSHDAVLAIYLFEMYMFNRTGVSCLNVSTKAHMSEDNLSEFIGPKFDQSMFCFMKNLEYFINCHASEVMEE